MKGWFNLPADAKSARTNATPENNGYWIDYIHDDFIHVICTHIIGRNEQRAWECYVNRKGKAYRGTIWIGSTAIDGICKSVNIVDILENVKWDKVFILDDKLDSSK